MAIEIPIERRIAWTSLAPQLAVMGLLIAGAHYVIGLRPFGLALAVGSGMYIAWSWLSKALVLRHHHRGIDEMFSANWANAARHFEASYAFLERYAWIDTHRYVLLFDSSAVSYREMALVNWAAALHQLGRHADAVTLYDRAIATFGQSVAAQTGRTLCEEALASKTQSN
jgi:tetratricopeptide (TPR) repeat protein